MNKQVKGPAKLSQIGPVGSPTKTNNEQEADGWNVEDNSKTSLKTSREDAQFDEEKVHASQVRLNTKYK